MKRHRNSPSARPTSAVSRREFLATSSAALLATNLDAAQAAAAPAAKLALDGGEKAVKQGCPPGIRVPIHEGMDEQYIAGVAEAIRKVARHYAV